jgi:hypothetical protein
MSSPINDNNGDSTIQDTAAAAGDPTKVNEDNSAVRDADLLVPETKAKNDDSDLLVDETNTSSNYVLADKKEAFVF